jgi:prenyltransferase/squalene oxidase-like repeat protein
MGLRALVLAALVASSSPAAYLAAHQHADGGFGEPGQASDPTTTAWVVLGLAAAGKPPAGAASYLRSQPVQGTSDVALRVLALRALGQDASALVGRLEHARRPSGRIGPLVDSTIWSVLALRSAGRPAGKASVRYLLRQQRPNGGWSWYPHGAPDSNDTAAAIEALRSTGVHGRAIRRGLRRLRRLHNRDGGFALTPHRASDAQSTAWAIQAFAAAHRKPPRSALRFLHRMRRPNGSFRYSKRYVTTPVFVTAQVLPALAKKPFPLKAP